MRVSLVGAGPGDPGLLTLKGRQRLAEADVIIHDALADKSLLDWAKADAEIIYVGKVAGSHTLPQDEINELLAQKATEANGKKVVRLKGGDPCIFGRGGEEAIFLAARQIPFEIVPGVSSAIAAPAYAGIPLTHRGFNSAVTIVTGHEDPRKPDSAIDWHALATGKSTLVFVMGMKNLAAIAARLIENGMAGATRAALIYRGTTPAQRTLVSSLEQLPGEAERLGFASPSIIVVGEVVSLEEKLDWFGKKPLLGRRIVVTRAREQASTLSLALQEAGADTLECPAIRIVPLQDYTAIDSAIQKIGQYAWVIFTSANGVGYFWQRLENAGKDSRSLSGRRIAAIGPATAEALAGKGITADLIPSSYVAEGLARDLVALEETRLNGAHILIPRAVKARDTLPDELRITGALVDVIPVYETVPTGNAASILAALMTGHLDCVTFASSSSVRNFLDLIPASELRAHPEVALAAIGPVTAQTLAENGLKAGIESKVHTIPGLVAAIEAYYAGKTIRPESGMDHQR